MTDKDIIEMMNFIDTQEIAKADLETAEIPSALLINSYDKVIKKVRSEIYGDRLGKRSLRKKRSLSAAAVVITLAIGISVLRLFSMNSYKASAIAMPQYPEQTAAYAPKVNELSKEFLKGLESFAFNSSSVILLSNGSDKNQLYSPISLYMSLALAADSAGGNTRSEILNALSMSSMDITEINKQSGLLFRYLYFKNSLGQLNLANSLWLDKSVKFKKDFLESAAKDYYAYSFTLDLDSDKASKQIGEWISHFTGGKLGSTIHPASPYAVMELINTVYFKDQWLNEFDSSKTAKDKFTLENGSKVNCDFMNMTCFCNPYAETKDYTVSGLAFKNGESMIFILPHEGISANDIIKNPGLLTEAVNALNSKDHKYGKVIFKVPEFKFYADMNLKDALIKMGINKVFDENLADFSNVSHTKPLYISGVHQSDYIAVNEKGCEAAAFTQIDYAGSPKPEGHAEIILDRPFIFAITGTDRVPLFIGVINNPLNQ